jgi:hypothetical protein
VSILNQIEHAALQGSVRKLAFDSLIALRNRIRREADAFAIEFRLGGETDGKWDAFRHAYVSARMAQSYGRITAELLGLAHEVFNPGKPEDAWMDVINNSVGAKIGARLPVASPRDLAKEVLAAVEAGVTANSPADAKARYPSPSISWPPVPRAAV